MKNRTILLAAFGAALLCALALSCSKDNEPFSDEPIDMGAAGIWATKNVGAKDPSAAGAKMTYDKVVEYVANNPEWALPTEKEWSSLISNYVREAYGYTFSANGKSIYIPFGAYPIADDGDRYVSLKEEHIKPFVLSGSEGKKQKFFVRLVKK